MTVFWTRIHSKRGSQRSGNLPNRELTFYRCKSAILCGQPSRDSSIMSYINAFASVDQVRIPAMPLSKCTCWTWWLLHYGNCLLGRALHLTSLVDRTESWFLGKIILSITVAVLFFLRWPTAHSWRTATTLSEDVGSRPEVSIIIYRGSSRCRDVKKYFFLLQLQPCEAQSSIGIK